MGIQPLITSLFLLVESRGGRNIGYEANGNNIIGAQLIQASVLIGRLTIETISWSWDKLRTMNLQHLLFSFEEISDNASEEGLSIEMDCGEQQPRSSTTSTISTSPTAEASSSPARPCSIFSDSSNVPQE